MYRIPFDHSTLNLEELRKLPAFRQRPGMQISEEPRGFGDPPGYPRYFERSVYNSQGNRLTHGPDRVITDPENSQVHWITDGEDLFPLWIPIPHVDFNHAYIAQEATDPTLRLFEWISHEYRYHQGGYYHPQLAKEHKRLWWPYGYIPEIVEYGINAIYQYDIDRKWYVRLDNGSRRELPKFKLEEYENALCFHTFLTPENYYPVHCIQKWYSEHQPIREWILNPPASKPQNDWWERYSDATLVVAPAHAIAYSETPIEIQERAELLRLLPEVSEEGPFTVSELLEKYQIQTKVEEVARPAYHADMATGSHSYQITYTRKGYTPLALVETRGPGNTDESDPGGVLLTYLQDCEDATQYSFDEWAGNLGYDPDSRSAEKIYKRELSINRKLKKFLEEQYQEFLDAE